MYQILSVGLNFARSEGRSNEIETTLTSVMRKTEIRKVLHRRNEV
jgi:hypothetical protein